MRRAVPGVLSGLLPFGCSAISGPDRPDVSVSFTAGRGHEQFSFFEVEIGGRRVSLEPGESRVSRTVRAPATGSLPVRVVLLGAALDTLASVELTQTFYEDRDHRVGGRTGLHRPLGHCIGTLVVAPLPVGPAGSEADTLFLTYGSIPKDAIC